MNKSYRERNSEKDILDESDASSSPDTEELPNETTFKWSKEKDKQLQEHIEYHAKYVEYLNDIRVNGPSKRPYPKQPASTLKSVLSKKTRTTDTSKERCLKISQMSDDEFDSYLKLLRNPTVVHQNEVSAVMPTTDLVSMGIYLRNSCALIKDKESALLKDYVQFGCNLKLAQKRFDQCKKENGSNQTWEQWIKENTSISASYARQIVEVSELIKDYPKLKELRVGFTEMYKMKSKIKEVLTRREDLREYWTYQTTE